MPRTRGINTADDDDDDDDSQHRSSMSQESSLILSSMSSSSSRQSSALTFTSTSQCTFQRGDVTSSSGNSSCSRCCSSIIRLHPHHRHHCHRDHHHSQLPPRWHHHHRHQRLAVIAAMASLLILVHIPGLLSSSMQIFSEHACDGEVLQVRCPPDTTIHVVEALYGKIPEGSRRCQTLVRDLFPSRYAENSEGALTDDLDPAEHSSSYTTGTGANDCLAENSRQKVVDQCQDQRSCHLLADTTTFGLDPCPGSTKYLEVKYKCRPSNFRTKEVCDGERIQLRCKEGLRVAIFSAHYGRGKTGSPQCNVPPAGNDDSQVCESSYSLEKVMSKCHGKRRCKFKARSDMFGADPCPGKDKYLQVVYTCEDAFSIDPGLSKSTINDPNGGKPVGGGGDVSSITVYLPDGQDGRHNNGRDYSPPLEEDDRNGRGRKHRDRDDGSAMSQHRSSSNSDDASVGVITIESLTIFDYMKSRQNTFIMIFLVTAAAGLTLFIVFAVMQFIYRRRRALRLGLSAGDDDGSSGGGTSRGGYQMVASKPTYQRAPDDTVISTDFTNNDPGAPGVPPQQNAFNGRTFRGSESPPVPRNYNRYYS